MNIALASAKIDTKIKHRILNEFDLYKFKSAVARFRKKVILMAIRSECV
jgi:hypothetical protein